MKDQEFQNIIHVPVYSDLCNSCSGKCRVIEDVVSVDSVLKAMNRFLIVKLGDCDLLVCYLKVK